jgi:hypothetical protein
MQIAPTIQFRIILTWREVKLLRRALELEGGAGRLVAKQITEQVNAAKEEAIRHMASITEEEPSGQSNDY